MSPNSASTSNLLEEGKYAAILSDTEAAPLIQDCLDTLVRPPSSSPVRKDGTSSVTHDANVAAAALNAFLQANVTGPVLADQASVEDVFLTALRAATSDSTASLRDLRSSCLSSLTVDGVAPYAHIPLLELFVLARHLFLAALKVSEGTDFDLRWMCLRVHVWHYKLLTQPTLGGSAFTKSAQWSDVPTLQETIVKEMETIENAMFPDKPGNSSPWSAENKVEFLLEKTGACVVLGMDAAAKAALEKATRLVGFEYTMSGALGKRTQWQEKDTSQLVVLAKSGTYHPADAASTQTPAGSQGATEQKPKPESISLNDDTLLEEIKFSKAEPSSSAETPNMPESLRELAAKPDDQPQLHALDHIILLADATIKDAFSPIDTLTAEEVLPFATRVLADKTTNWQVYTHALLVRSRIEVHRSRTIERGVLQMQAVVDQVVADTTTASAAKPPTSSPDKGDNPDQGTPKVPSISVTTTDGEPSSSTPSPPKATSFLPAPKPSESAPPQTRLIYVHCLFSPPKWHLESELAYAWAGAGSLVSALEIFKRLRLWPEVALCFASAAASGTEDGSGRGSGGEDKARAIIRWRLFNRSGDGTASRQSSSALVSGLELDDEDNIEVERLKWADFTGPERDPPPPNAPRLFCILGDIESDPSHFERAWELSKRRYARAQKSLGEHYLSERNWEAARESYKLAVGANRLSSELWSRLGDINLRLGRFADAAEGFSRAIGAAGEMTGGEDARTWSNLGSALWSLHCEVVEAKSTEEQSSGENQDAKNMDNSKPSPTGGLKTDLDIVDHNATATASDVISPQNDEPKYGRDPNTLLLQSLNAFKRGATLSTTNWRIWDNVITLASRMRPIPAYNDILHAIRQVLRLRNSENAIDIDVLRSLLQDLVLSKEVPPAVTIKSTTTTTSTTTAATDNAGGSADNEGTGDVYSPPRGTKERAVVDLLEGSIVPVITTRDDLWELVSRCRVWRRDYGGAVDAAEKAWRASVATGSIGVGVGAMLAPSGNSKAGGKEDPVKVRGPWTEDEESWGVVVQRTDELVSVLENYGDMAGSIGAKWKGRAKMAVRSVMGKGRERWEGSEGWKVLEGVAKGLA